MTVGAVAVPKTVSHDLHPASQTLFLVTADAFQLRVSALERIVGELPVGEGLDRERLGDVTGVTLAFGCAEPKLTGVNVPVASRTVARRPAVRRTSPAEPILFRGTMAAVAGRLGVSAGQRPGAVVDLGGAPTALGMAMRTAPVAHFAGELIAVRIVVAVDAALRFQVQFETRPLCAMATGARCSLVPPQEGEASPAVLPDGELRRPKPMLVVARRAVRVSKRPAVHVSMAVTALLELQAPISPLGGKLGRVALVACNTLMQAFEWKHGERMSA